MAFWKSSKLPTLNNWYLKTWDYFLQDKISILILKSDNMAIPKNLQEKCLPLLSAASTKKIDTSLFANHTYYDLLSYF